MEILVSIFKLLRIFVVFKVVYLLYMNSQNPSDYPIEGITWWIYFLIFDIWVNIVFTDKEEDVN